MRKISQQAKEARTISHYRIRIQTINAWFSLGTNLAILFGEADSR
jgi:hypothetical protein